MNFMYRIVAIGLLLALSRAVPAQLGEINFLTDLLSPFPAGCVALDLPAQPASADNTLIDQTISAPTVLSTTRDGQMRVTIWRVGCPDDNYSVVMVRLRQTGGANPIVMPQVFAEGGDVAVPFHEAQLIRFPAVGNVGASGGIVTEAGETFMLAVDPVAIDGATFFLPEDYNDLFTFELFWGTFNDVAAPSTVFLIDPYQPQFDPPQFAQPVLHGRHSGQWIVPGVPRTGLVLQVVEMGINPFGVDEDKNYTFAIFFTYLNGQPFWVTGNTDPAFASPGVVEMDLFALQGGAFFTSPNQPPDSAVTQTRVGSMSIRPLDCNRLRVDYEFGPIGQGAGTLEFERLIRIAGYDCNPWE